MLELEKALAQLKNKQAPGPDKVSNDMLKHLGPQAKKKLHQLFNASWKTSNIPKTWKKAITIPILKCGKCRTKAESSRPISLTSSVCKLMERIVNARLMWLLEKDKLLMPEQAGFRQLRSAEDQLAYISQMIEDGFQEKQHTVAVWIDMEKNNIHCFHPLNKKVQCERRDERLVPPKRRQSNLSWSHIRH